MKISSMSLCALVAGGVNFSTAQIPEGNYPGHTFGLGYVELLLEGEESQIVSFLGNEVTSKDVGNGVSENDFVYDDPRAFWRLPGSPNIRIGVNDGIFPANSQPNLNNPDIAAVESIEQWTNLHCASKAEFDIGIDNPEFPGCLEQSRMAGGLVDGCIQADIKHVGFPNFFNFFTDFDPNALAFTATMLFFDEDGNPTDINGDGKFDVAFREIYYNPSKNWSDTDEVPDGSIDFLSVALHEMGHSLSIEHFGTMRMNKKTGEQVANPRVVMNAAYLGELRTLKGRDKASFCNAWADWPNQ